MKVYGIINRGISHIYALKFSKMSDDVTGGITSSVERSYARSNLFNNDRGTLTPRDIGLVQELKTTVKDVLNLISAPKKGLKKKLLAYNRLLESPDNMLAVNVDNPRITAFSGEVKNIKDEQYFDFTVYGYFGDKKRFLINNEGEIIKKPSAKFFTGEKLTASDKESVYYTQNEINNLEIRRYMNMFKTEVLNLKNDILGKESVAKPKKVAKVTEKPFDPYSFIYKQKETLDTIHRKFNIVYCGIMNNARTSIQRRKLSEICGVTLHKKFPIMCLNDINHSMSSATVNFTQIGSKPVTRILVQNGISKSNRLFIDGQLVEELSRDGSNPFTIGRISKSYTPKETEELGVAELLENIDKKLDSSIIRLRAMLGKKIDK